MKFFLNLCLLLALHSFAFGQDRFPIFKECEGLSDIAALKQCYEKKLDELDLRVKIMDSANYNPDYPRFSVIEQVPAAGKFVKEDRKIYIKLNPSGYPKLEIPEFERITKRQVESKLLSLGFKIGDITYKPDFAENAVLELSHNGKRLKAGDKLKKTAIIDMVLGDGQVNYNSER